MSGEVGRPIEQGPAPFGEQQLLERAAHVVESRILPRGSEELDADGQPVFGGEADRQRDAGHAGEVRGIVATSFRYMARGSSSFSPSLNAVVGAVGVASTSTVVNAASKSRCTSVRTFWALP